MLSHSNLVQSNQQLEAWEGKATELELNLTIVSQVSSLNFTRMDISVLSNINFIECLSDACVAVVFGLYQMCVFGRLEQNA